MHSLMIDKIVAEGTPAQMREMRDWIVDVVHKLKKDDFAAYICAEKHLHHIVWGDHLGEPLATKWVSKMKNKDGSCGAHWTIDQTTQVAKDRSISYDKWDWYAVLNMVYSDYFNARYDINTYVELAKDWLKDEDIGAGKLLDYYYYVVCHK